MNCNGSQNITEILFAMIRSEICGTRVDENIKDSFSDDLLQGLYRLAKAHDAAHIVSSALYTHGLLGEDEASKNFKKERIMSVYRHENMQYAFGEICSVLEKQEIPYIPLKGSVIRSFYPEAWMRTSCDIDILIHEEDLNCAADALVEMLGYKADSRVNYHDISLYSQTGIHVELHFSIKENMDNVDGLLSEVWEHSCREKEDGFRHNQTPEYFVFHHVAHMSYHFVHGGCGIKPFMDMYIIRNNMRYDDTTVRNYCRQCGLESFYDNMLYVTDVWFARELHTPLSQQIEEYIMKGGVYGSLENQVAVAQSKRGGKTGYIISRMFVPYGVLKNYYPILKKHKWLFPFMQIRRWFGFIFSGGFERGVREVRANQKVSESQVSSMSSFLNEVGL